MSNMRSANELKKGEILHFNSLARIVDAHSHLDSVRERYILSKCLRWLSKLNEGALIVEVGGGAGHVAIEVVKKGFNIVTSDISQGMLCAAKERFERENLIEHADFIVADGETLPFANESLDCVLVVSALHHMVSPWDCLQEIHRCLSTGGYLILGAEPKLWPSKLRQVTSSAFSIKLRKLLKLYSVSRISPVEERGKVGFKKKELLGVLNKAGFRPLEVNNLLFLSNFLTGNLWKLPQASHKALIFVDRVLGKIPLLKEASWNFSILSVKLPH